MKKINWEEIIELCCRLYVFIFLNFYGWAKVFGGQFYAPERTPERVLQTTIEDVSDFDLAWSFMGRSFGYMLFLGISEIIGAWLLLFNRTKLLGTLMLLVILINVIVFDIFFLDAYGALGSAIIYTILLLIILWINRIAVIQSLHAITINNQQKDTKIPKLKVYILTALLMAILFGVNQFIVGLLGYGKG